MAVTMNRPSPAGSARLTFAETIQRTAFTAFGRLPQQVLRCVAPRSANSDGEVMAPEIAVIMNLTATGPDFSDGSVADARALVDADARTFAEDLPTVHVTDLELPGGLRASLYRPGPRAGGLVLFFHGGGFVLGSRAAYDSPARFIAAHANVDVLSIEYRLAPEAPFPAPIDDATTAWAYAVEHAADWGHDPERIVLLGDSAGANICAVLAHELRAESVRPALQVLMYPVLDLTGDYASRSEFADNPALTAKQIAWFTDHYVPEPRDRCNPKASPMKYANFSGLPPTAISIAGFDPLRDEAIAYAERLEAAGVPVQLLREGGLVHGYISMTRISRTSRDAVGRICDLIARRVR